MASIILQYKKVILTPEPNIIYPDLQTLSVPTNAVLLLCIALPIGSYIFKINCYHHEIHTYFANTHRSKIFVQSLFITNVQITNCIFYWPCILIVFVMKTNLMHYLSLIYFDIQPLHVSDILSAYHQEVFTL
jgi:hypothetical protein